MKLRNKKTGETTRDCLRQLTVSTGSSIYEYDSLTELNEEWEDYTPKEPLFTEKAGRILRDWAELNGLEKEKFYCHHIDDETITFVAWKMPNARGFEFDVPKGHTSMKITVGADYTLDELCGEEE